MEHKITQILDLIDNDAKISQQKIADHIGVSVGTVNMLIKKIARKGLIKIKKIDLLRINYYLTPKGIKTRMKNIRNYIVRSYKEITSLSQYIIDITKHYDSYGNKIWILGNSCDIYKLLISTLNDIKVPYNLATSLNDIEFKDKVVVYYWDPQFEKEIKDIPEAKFINLLLWKENDME